MKRQPPNWAIRFLRWYCKKPLLDAVLGDLLELYSRRYNTYGKTKADLLFILNVFLFFKPFALKQSTDTFHINNFTMLQNSLKIAWRNMMRQKMYSFIKIGGFALGLATCIVIALFIKHEISYDKHYVHGKNIYRVYNEFSKPDGGKWTSFPAPIGNILKTEYPEIESAARLIPYNWFNAGSNLVRREDQLENTYEERFAYADPELLDILEIPLVYGNRLHALSNPNSIVISKSKADLYFPKQDPTGKTIILNEDKSRPYVIGGVMEDFPATSHLQYNFLITLTGEEFWEGEQGSWCCWNYNAYIRLKPDTDVEALEKKMLKIRDTHYAGYLEQTGDQNLNDVKKYHSFQLQPVSDIYLKSKGIGDALSHGDYQYVWLFGAVACFILILACINFINLSTARSANRAKEVGLRKVVGSLRIYIVRQFLTESLLYSFVSFIMALLIVWLTLPYFSVLAGKSLYLPWNEWWLLPTLVLSAIVIGIVAGIYPSFYLSSFKPIDVLKGSISRGSKSSTLRSAMVVFQFTTSIVLIIGTFIIYKQINFILNSKVGYDKEQVIMLQGANTLGQQHDTFKNELLKLAGVEHVTVSNYLPVGGTKRDQNMFWRDGKSKEEKGIGAQKWYVDADYISTLGMKIIEGRNFMPEMASDSQSIIINKSMAKAFGFTKPLGERIMTWETYTVVGVVEDFHFESMKGEIGPLAFVLGGGGSIVSAKVNSNNMKNVIASISTVWDKFLPNQPIRYTFLDESYAKMYEDVQRMGYIFTTFACLAIIVACLGLFALSAYMVEQRNKEVSIRLVLGASVKQIFSLLTTNFVKLVLISFVIATPLAWYLMKTWLEDYEYKIEITFDIFIISGVISLIIALLTISYQSLRAALTNPATNLRSE